MRRIVSFQGAYRALLGACALSLLATSWSQTITWLGDFIPTQVSNNAVVVGYRWSGSAYSVFRWSRQDGLQEIAPQLGQKSASAAVSNDGDIVWGGYQYGYFRWIHSSAQLQLFNLDGRPFYHAKDVSADGSIAVGDGINQNGLRQALYVSAANGLPVWSQSFSRGLESVSDDGKVVAGWDYYYPAIWVFDDGVLRKVSMFPPPGVMVGGRALTVSSDGRYVGGSFGIRDDQQQYRSFGCIWEVDTSSQDPPVATPRYTIEGRGVWSMSADASKCLVVQYAYGEYQPALWFPQEGRTRALRHPEASRIEVKDMSPNGRYVVGTAINRATGSREAFLLDISVLPEEGDVDGNGCVDDADLLAVLFAFGNTGTNLPEDLTGDGTVDDADLLEVLFNFGSGC